MRVRILVGWALVATAALGATVAAARTQCTNDVTAACTELAGHVGRYDQLLWAVCAADSETVCKCWNAQQPPVGEVDWCQWAACACSSLADATLKEGVCGLSAACTSIAAVKERQQKATQQSAPAKMAAAAEQVRNGQVADCAPDTCMAVGATCARAAGALEILKDQGKLDAGRCATLAKDPAAFAKQLHMGSVSPAVAACACSAVF